VAPLLRYSLARRDGQALSVHRLVQAVTRDRLGTEDRKSWSECAVGLLNEALPDFPHDAFDAELSKVYERILPHAVVAVKHAETAGVASKDAARILLQLGFYKWMRGELQGACQDYNHSRDICERIYGQDNAETATRLSALGLVFKDLSNVDDARAVCERALELDERVLGPDHENVARDQHNLGLVLKASGDLAGARMALERALAINKRALRPDDPKRARDANDLGVVLHELGELAGAKEAFETVLAIDKRILPPDHPNLVRDKHNLGSVLKDLLRHKIHEPGSGTNTVPEIVPLARQFIELRKEGGAEEEWRSLNDELQSDGFGLTLATSFGPLIKALEKVCSTQSDLDMRDCARLVDTAVEFVDKQGGSWEEAEWQEYLGELEQKGLNIPEYMKEDLGDLLESLALFYFEIAPDRFPELVDTVTLFLQQHMGSWTSADWDQFLFELERKGFEVTHRFQDFVGKLLDQLNRLYLKEMEQRLALMVELASRFVEQQKGIWGETEWTGFLEDLQAHGVRITNETKENLHAIVKSMTSLYRAATATEEIEVHLSDISHLTYSFIMENKLMWGHNEWQSFVRQVNVAGIDLTKETNDYLGGLAEAMRATCSSPFINESRRLPPSSPLTNSPFSGPRFH
jgi:tetratricopeptide (TPR) repeat protein